jgi:hypothetical protein
MPNKPLPQFVVPMAAASVKEPFDSLDWIFEPKLDGYRAITVIDDFDVFEDHNLIAATRLEQLDDASSLDEP